MRFLFLKILLIYSSTIAAQGILTDFGQNRIQYHDFDWFYYDSPHFRIYSYLGGQEIGKFSAIDAERSLKDIENKLEFESTHKMEILVYNDYTDFQQTNIDLQTQTWQTGGTTHITDNKIFVYFDGNHQNLHRQIKKGIAEVLIAQMLFGGTIQEVLMNGLLLNLPDWFLTGLITYLVDDWSTTDDNLLRELILQDKIKDFKSFSILNPSLAGHSMWYYIATNYGRNAIPNLVYVTRINRNLNTGFAMTLGTSFNNAQLQWQQYFIVNYNKDKNHTLTTDEGNNISLRRKRDQYNFRISPRGNPLAYIENNHGKYRVKMYDISKKSNKKIMKGGTYSIKRQLQDYKPLIAWSPNGKTLAIINEKRDQYFLTLYEIESSKKTKSMITKFQQIHSITYGSDANTLILSAINNSVSDIYVYKINTTNIINLTNDHWDDIEPAYYSDGKYSGVLFASNRTDDSLRYQKMDSVLAIKKNDIWFYDIQKPKKTLTQITQTPNADERRPIQFDSTHYTFIGDDNGIYNLYRGDTHFDSLYVRTDMYYYFHDSTITNPQYNLDSILDIYKIKPDSVSKHRRYRPIGVNVAISNNTYSIQDYDATLHYNKFITSTPSLGNIQLVQSNKPNTVYSIKQTIYANHINTQQSKKEIEHSKREITFQLEYPNAPTVLDNKNAQNKSNSSASTTNTSEAYKYRPTKVVPYKLTFRTQNITTQLDNTILFNRYENYNTAAPGFSNPDLSGMLRIAVFDLMEDYRFYGGFKFPTHFNGTEYFLIYENFKKRLDWRYIFHRKSDLIEYPVTINGYDYIVAWKIKQMFGQATIIFPFDKYMSLRFHQNIRWDRLILPSRDIYSAAFPDYNEYWSGSKLEFIYDNTINPTINIYKGTRAKIYYEFYKQWNKKNNYISVIGLDLRGYHPVYKNIIWANRFAAASSFGQSKVLYYLGGTENWINWGGKEIFDYNTPINENYNYNYQSLATNMRGFLQNTRNGNNYAIASSELRIPLLQTIFRKPLQSAALRNLQLIGFIDIGSAWKGMLPFANDGPPEYITIANNNVVLQVDYFHNPIIAGYGGGIRTTLVGYFIRFDVAYAWDSGFLPKPIYYFSFGTDF